MRRKAGTTLQVIGAITGATTTQIQGDLQGSAVGWLSSWWQGGIIASMCSPVG
jgi:hypothetical protein